MQLSMFIRESLLDIRTGVHDANTKHNKKKPAFAVRASEDRSMIDFDVAVVSAMHAKAESHWIVRVVGCYVKEGEQPVQNPSRIRFSVAVNDAIE